MNIEFIYGTFIYVQKSPELRSGANPCSTLQSLNIA